MGSLRQIDHINLVGDGLTQSNRKFHACFLEFLAGQDALHWHDAWLGVRYFDTDGTLTRNRSDDTDTQSGNAQGDIIFQITDLRDTDTFCRSDFVQGNGRTYAGLDGTDFDAEATEHFNDAVLVGILFLHVHTVVAFIVVVEQVKMREFVVLQVQTRIVRFQRRTVVCFILFGMFVAYGENRLCCFNFDKFRYCRLNGNGFFIGLHWLKRERLFRLFFLLFFLVHAEIHFHRLRIFINLHNRFLLHFRFRFRFRSFLLLLFLQLELEFRMQYFAYHLHGLAGDVDAEEDGSYQKQKAQPWRTDL